MATSAVFQPPVQWAQRKDSVFLTVNAEDSKKPKIEITDEKLHIRGRAGPDQREFECVIEFYKPIDATKARQVTNDRSIQFVLPKKETGPFWPRLMNSNKKVHWIKIDFNRWKDEDDDSDEERMNWDLNDMMGKMGGLGGDGKPDFDDFEDSDNEELPDLEDDKEESDKTPEKSAEGAKNAESATAGATT